MNLIGAPALLEALLQGGGIGLGTAGQGDERERCEEQQGGQDPVSHARSFA
jgi:hypothetical protein